MDHDIGADYDEKKGTQPIVTVTDAFSVKDEKSSPEITQEMREKILDRFGNKARDDHLNAVSRDIDFVLDKILTISREEALEILIAAVDYHNDDVNFPAETMEKIKLLVAGEDAFGADPETYDFDLKTEACLIGFYSPYPEVRSVTDPFDDPTIYSETMRVYFLAIIWTIIGTGVSQFFTFRKPSILITSAVIQLFLFPCGKFMALVMPDWGFTLWGTRHSLNPGPWTFKEQMLATLMVNVANGGTYVTRDNILTLQLTKYYGIPVHLGYEFLMNFSSQFFGFGLAGLLRRWVCYPVKMVWPTALVTIATNRALMKPERKESINGWTISSYKFFITTFIASFCYFWLPQYLFQALSSFNWMTWIAPQNFNLAIITGSSLGLGVNPIPSFDWNILNYDNALSVPFFSCVNQYIGMVLGLFCILGVYYGNYKWAGYIPVNTNDLRDRFNESYNVSRILTNGLIDEKKYQEYSPPYYSAGFMVTYGSYFAMYPLTLVYIFLKDWRLIASCFKDFWKSVRYGRSNYDAQQDPHCRMMAKYKEVPDWYYLVILFLSFVFGVVCVEVYRTESKTAVYGIVVTIIVSIVFLIPISIIQATTGFQMSISVMSEMIAGFMFPGNGLANLVLKCYGYQTEKQAETYVIDQKMAHYAKVAPMGVFRGQMVTTIFQCLVSIGVLSWQLSNIDGLCDSDQPDRFSCPGIKTIYSASVMWGVIGPLRTFQGVYSVFSWCFLVGLLLAPVFYILTWKFPKQFRYVNICVVVGGIGNWSPYNLSYYTGNLYLSAIFMFFIRRRYLAWWEKYNYVFSAAMTAGVAFSAIIIFFSVQYKPKPITWWGNTVSDAGIDGTSATRFALPEKGYFGLEPGTFP
ncbi:OPT oligopeptide transporter protein-domain-containing protein [Myxozyma melibiosi]|uniref:OPT oligopeptide transporter protein-domain-containing protein n=1 Tax=Myxozyma melibiosi TaxID=54550 RepID=A0ABR1F156_9ASCO